MSNTAILCSSCGVQNLDTSQFCDGCGASVGLAELGEAAFSVLHRLREAYDVAFTCGRDAWDFSVELSQMQKVGVETHVLRLLICKDWIIHKRETAQGEEGRRIFESVNSLVLSDQSCFVISKKGYEVAKSTIQVMNPNNASGRTTMSSHHSGPSGRINERTSAIDSNQLGSASRPHRSIKPVWDRERRELRLGEIVVKRFKWRAENQERILNAFEDLEWPPRIDDPLDAHPSICPKQRLHDTLKCLNRNQANELLKFRGDGTARGVLLEIRIAD